jgi:hypothetical protein
MSGRELRQPWFATFKDSRHQITHRNTPIIQIIITAGDPRIGITIPNDPTKSDPHQANGDFSENFGINRYCLIRRNDVLNLIE